MNATPDWNVLITAGATVLGTLIGGGITLITTRRDDKLLALKEVNLQLSHDLIRASEQVAAYHALEGEYAGDLAATRGGSARTVKTEYRNRVEALGFTRPNWTQEKAREVFESATETTA